MEYGAHLPIIGFAGTTPTLGSLRAYAAAACELGYGLLAANDHLTFPRPWLDGPTALTAVLPETGHMTLATTIALPVVRGPASLARTLAAVDLLSGGRLVAGVGAGSSARDYAAAGIAFDERWGRLDEAIRLMRALWREEPVSFDGRYYQSDSLSMRPLPRAAGGPPLWIGSWGSEAGLRRVARLGDGWLASGYNTTPGMFAAALGRLRVLVGEAGRSVDAFPNAVATMFVAIVEDWRRADALVRDMLAPALNRPEYVLRQRVLIGPAEVCAERLAAYSRAGAQRVILWPVVDELRQLELFQTRVAPLVAAVT